jgi:hypothetical protein
VNFRDNQKMLLWALCASLVVFLLGAINLLRAGRKGDPALAWICLAGGICWIAASVRFGALVGNLADMRVLIFVLITRDCARSVCDR